MWMGFRRPTVPNSITNWAPSTQPDQNRPLTIGSCFTYADSFGGPGTTLDGKLDDVAIGMNAGPVIVLPPTNQAVNAGWPATFSVTATGTAPLTYQWRKNGVNIPGATANPYTTAAATTNDNGAQYGVVVANADGSVTSSVATLTVKVNHPPVANAQNVSTLEDTAKVITLTGSDLDGDVLTYTNVTLPVNGILTGMEKI